MLHPESLENEGAADPPTVPSYSEERRGGRTFPVVGIGASAGGLEAASSLLAGLPQSPGMAFVLVQHLDPKHESRLCDLLAKVTRLHVLEASQGLALRPDHVYVIPPNTSLTLEQGILQVTPRDEVRGLHLPIDRFFKSLAKDRLAGAIGVILSGTGSDGTLGLEEIKAAGGITFAQDEASAKFPSMPLSAIGSGCVDIVLPPEEIASELTRICRHPYVASAETPRDGSTAGHEEQELFRRILALVRSTVGVDFSDYRDTTIKRRILRRTVLQTGGNLAEYAGLLERDRSEVVTLYHDVLINVTSFFRDPETFEVLKDVVFSSDLGGQGADRAHPHLGAGLLQRSGTLLAGDGTPGGPRGQAGPTPGPDLRHRPQRRDRAEQGSAGGLSREHRGRGVSGTTAPLLHQGRRQATGSARPYGRPASSPGITWRPTRPSPGWTW